MKGIRGCEQCDMILDAEGVDEACMECWLNDQRRFKLNGRRYVTDSETRDLLRSIIPNAKASGDSSAVIAVMEVGIASGRIRELA